MVIPFRFSVFLRFDLKICFTKDIQSAYRIMRCCIFNLGYAVQIGADLKLISSRFLLSARNNLRPKNRAHLFMLDEMWEIVEVAFFQLRLSGFSYCPWISKEYINLYFAFKNVGFVCLSFENIIRTEFYCTFFKLYTLCKIKTAFVKNFKTIFPLFQMQKHWFIHFNSAVI